MWDAGVGNVEKLRCERRMNPFLDEGDLVPDATVLELMEQWSENQFGKSDVLLGEFSRTLGQLEAWVLG